MLRWCILVLPLAFVLSTPAGAQSPASWTQRVEYDMDISLHADAHQYTGRQTLTYTNNSPDTLRTVYYHLYFNAFQPTSMMAERNRHLPDPDGRIVPRIFNLSPDEQGWPGVEPAGQRGDERGRQGKAGAGPTGAAVDGHRVPGHDLVDVHVDHQSIVGPLSV